MWPHLTALGASHVDQTVYGMVDVTRTLREKPKTWDEILQPQLKRREEQEAARVEQERVAAEIAAQEAQVVEYVPPVVQTGNGYSYGQCTWYVASRRAVPGNWGNAANWYYGAQSSGFATGITPQPGAIGVERGINHVVYVEAVLGDTVTVSEMNFVGWNVKSFRTAPASAFLYIY